uniref:Uncharacterized protein n=1 Tax=Rhizophagus irregularis (strain DAOM 181602 / DAOM 197198 / MUCL 43194) TaxID=747089 RepID=U9T6V1_RHIID
MFFLFFFVGIRLQQGRRYSRNVLAWIPNPKEFGSNEDADIPGNRLQLGRRYSRFSFQFLTSWALDIY